MGEKKKEAVSQTGHKPHTSAVLGLDRREKDPVTKRRDIQVELQSQMEDVVRESVYV